MTLDISSEMDLTHARTLKHTRNYLQYQNLELVTFLASSLAVKLPPKEKTIMSLTTEAYSIIISLSLI